MRALLVVVVVLTPARVGRAVPPAKPDAKAILGKLKGEWREFEAAIPLKNRPALAPAEGLEWWFLRPGNGDPPARSYLTDWENEAGQTVGELVLNPDADPMWLDFKYQDGGREYVWAGIIRFDGDDLRWVRSPKGVPVAEWAAARGEVATRPARFEDGAGRPLGYRLVRLKPSGK